MILILSCLMILSFYIPNRPHLRRLRNHGWYKTAQTIEWLIKTFAFLSQLSWFITFLILIITTIKKLFYEN
jgi:hypothetical protein